MAKSAAKIAVDCPRCGGIGNIPRFGHTWHGVCFDCKGSGKVMVAKNSKKRPHYHVTIGNKDHGVVTAGLAVNKVHLAINSWHLPYRVVDTDTGIELNDEDISML